MIKAETTQLSERYQAALEEHLSQRSRAKPLQAGELGRQATLLGVETLDLAHIHAGAVSALSKLERSSGLGVGDGAWKRAHAFFIQAMIPIEEGHRQAMDARAKSKVLDQSLRARTAELAKANRKCQQENLRRKAAEASLAKARQRDRLLAEESRRMHEQLRHLSRQILLAQEQERKQISRELHDDIAQTLTAINVHLEALSRESATNIQGLTRKITRTQKLVAKSVNIVHRFARELRPTVLDDLGLIPALKSHLKDFAKRAGLQVRFSAFPGVEQLNDTKRTVLYRVGQAALTNVAQHARASHVKLSIQGLKDAVRMEIKDDGKGFDPEKVRFSRKRQRLGLLGMRERVEMVGGTFSVQSAPGQGTTIRARIPFTNGNHP
jgi:signal transduction histidine kinase